MSQIAGSGLFGHFFLSDTVAQSIGWPKGNPFQLEVAFANLAIGVLGIVAMGRRHGFREATVIAVSVFSLGSNHRPRHRYYPRLAILAPGNTLQNVSNLLRPVLLIGFLCCPSGGRSARSSSETTRPTFEAWRAPRVRAVGLMTVSVATGFGVGFGIGSAHD